PAMVRKEIWSHVLAYNLIRKIMAQAASIHNKKPRELSFKRAIQISEAFRQIEILKNDKYYASLLKAIAQKKLNHKPGRQEPRRVKHRPKSYPLLVKPRAFYYQEFAKNA
ncbi:MAG: IS4 family transposase, partial [Gammaproteobacteria bacterium]|nr:IS4 family transposase [Gammaproteobacteria bacterium]